jgi:hypothetical protein
MNGSHFCLEIHCDKKDTIEFKHINREKFLTEASRLINDFVNNSIKCTFTSPNDGLKNTTIRIYTY